MKPEKANTLLRGLRPLLPGVVLSALSSMGLLLGLEGLLFDLLGLVWLILLLAGLKVLSPWSRSTGRRPPLCSPP